MNANQDCQDCFSDDALLLRVLNLDEKRNARWREAIKSRDFKVYFDSKGCVTVEWPNTKVFAPANYAEFAEIICREFLPEELPTLTITAGIMSLIAATSIRRKHIPSLSPKPKRSSS